MNGPTAMAVLYQLASVATIARTSDTEATNRQLREHLKEFDPTHLRILAAALTPPAPASAVVVNREALRRVLEQIEIPANGSTRVYFVATNEFRAAYLALFDALFALKSEATP